MNIKPIPLNLLIHTIIYTEVEGSDGWDDNEKVPITIENVRVQPSSSLRRSSNSKGIDYNNIVFIDMENSSSCPEFKEKSTVTWNNKDYEIVDVLPVHGAYDIHHYELGLK